MNSINVKCPVPRCSYETGLVPEAVAVALLTTHTTTHTAGNPVHHGPKLERPQIDMGISAEEWKLFQRRWKLYTKSSNIGPEEAATQLFQCTSQQLGDAVLRYDHDVIDKSEELLMQVIESLAVIPVATMVLRAELLTLHQLTDESYRNFLARVRGKAEICSYSTTHTCQCKKINTIDFTETIVRDVMVAGIRDEDIRRKVMSIKDLCTKSTNDIVALVEAEEMARDSIHNVTPTNSASTSAVSHSQSSPPKKATDDRHKEGQCPQCNKKYKLYTKGRYGWNVKPHETCITCYLAKKKTSSPVKSRRAANTSIASQMASVSAHVRSVTSHGRKKQLHHKRERSPLRLTHHIFSKGEWKKAQFMKHPTISITVSVDNNHYNAFGLRCPSTSAKVVRCITDTGAQSNLWSLKECLEMGFHTDDLIPVKVLLSAANNSGIEISGAILVQLSGKNEEGHIVSCSTMVYVSPSVQGFYLSQETMMELGIIPRSFPSIGDAFQKTCLHEVNGVNIASNLAEKCSCPPRKAVPPRPTKLPIVCKPENIEMMERWLLETFSSSTFNTCPHQQLPCMTGPPIEMHLDPTAVPRVCHTPANVPIHWHEKVKADLERDVALGVIEKVPYGEPVEWCHRMVVTRKHDGTPRRTVDLSPLNKYCKRETFAMESPFHLARKIPGETWKTVSDAWNGYHSVPLRESDRHLTTFITPFGRYRYKRAPQGFVSSGDGYNRRFDAILSDFVRKERCVDDTIHYDSNLEEHWWRTIDFLRMVGEAGIVLNPAKFQFCKKSVEFAGFRVSGTAIEPLPKYIDAIRDFPTPKNLTDIRSWFGLVNQVANYAQLREVMAPFRPFLSPKNPFQWTAELEKSFSVSKEAIVNAIIKGVEIFDLTKKTCLRPDWSRQGIGYFLLQKHCECVSNLPDCCLNGWRIVLAGSRFLSSAEQRYAPVEGEALAVAWGLEQSKYFTQGCEDLIVVTDHKPLVKILGDRTLDEITNSRLFRLKQRTLPWHFTIAHMPGKTNLAADATSRNPSPRINDYSDDASNALLSENDGMEICHNAAICEDVSSTFCISWSDLKAATAADAVFHRLAFLLENGFPENRGDLAQEIIPFWNFKDMMYVHDGVIMYNDRVVVPRSLRPSVVAFLHSAHQGVSMMESRARSLVFWPGMSQDIQRVRDACVVCCKNAPSQAATPAVQSYIPSTPFECIVADYFESHGRTYLVVADRLSGWVEIFSAPSGTGISSATGLIANLRQFFSVFGVPEELSTDGGPQFKASVTQDFLAKWGVHHRVSSAYFPQSNGRAEVAVKAAKRLLLTNIGPSGTLNNDKFLRAILQLRNTPDPDCKVSPAEIVFGRRLKDAFSFVNRIQSFKNPGIRPMWREAWRAKENALRIRFTRTMERLNSNARDLPPLQPGERVFVQNQTGRDPKRWDKSGLVVEAHGNDQYLIKIDGSGRVTLRNRRFLRSYTPASPTFPQTVGSPMTLQQSIDDDQQIDQPLASEWDSREQSSPHATPHPQLIQHTPAEPASMMETVTPVSDDIPEPITESVPEKQHQSPLYESPTFASSRPRRTPKPRELYDAASGTWIPRQ